MRLWAVKRIGKMRCRRKLIPLINSLHLMRGHGRLLKMREKMSLGRKLNSGKAGECSENRGDRE